MIIGIVVLVVIGVFVTNKVRAGSGGPKLITDKVKLGDLIETVSATGSVNAQTGAEVHIGSQLTGVIKRLYADVGTKVKAGQLIAQLDLPDLAANLGASQQAFDQAQTRFVQQVTGVGQVATQSSTGLDAAQQGVLSAQAKLAVANANLKLQMEATPTDIEKATTGLAVAQAALNVAMSNLKTVQAASNLAVVNAKEGLTQAQANLTNATVSENRLIALVAKGYAAQAALDAAHDQTVVNASLVRSAQENITLTTEKVADDIQTAKDQLMQAQQNVASANAALRAARAETNTTLAREADVKDARTALGQAQAALQLAKVNVVNNQLKRQDVQAAQEAVRQAKDQVAYNKAQVAKSVIKSPIAGTVLQLSVQQGETLAAGLSAPTVIIVADLSRLQIDAYVDETDIGKVRLGQRASCSVDAFPDRTFSGKVQKIAAGSTIQQGVVTYDVTIAIQDPDEVLRPDMTANVNIETGRRSNVLLVPAVAVQAGASGSTVNVIKTDGGQRQTVPVKVKTGGTDGVYVEIKSGLKEGDKIVLAGMTTGPARGPNSPFGPSGGGSRGGGGGGGGGGGR